MADTSDVGPLKIGILGWELLQVLGGANDFVRNLIRALKVRPNTTVYFIAPKQQDELIYPHYLEADSDMIRLYEDCEAHTLQRLRKEHEIDCFMLSIYVYPTDLPYLVYWPDCQHRRLPEFFDEPSRKARDERIQSLLATGKPLIINAKTAKDDIVEFFGAKPDQIFNLPVAPIVQFDHLTPRPELALKYNVPEPYFIISNQFWVHKSLETVVEAADIVRNRGVDVNFVFTGKMEEPRFPTYPQQIMDMVKAKRLDDRVRFLGHLPKVDQLELMKRAIAVVQPTLFEGGPGGGSVYDATGIGVRAIISDIACNRELPPDPEKRFWFKPRVAADLADQMIHVVGLPYTQPTIEDLYQISKRSIEVTSVRSVRSDRRRGPTHAAEDDMSGARVSVITVCLNARDVIRLTLESVRRQSIPVDHIIIDGGSTDGTLVIVNEYDVAYLSSEKDKGVYDAMEKARSKATGEFTIFLNAGDCFFDEHVCRDVAAFFDRSGADMVFGNIMPVYLRASDTHDHGAFQPGVMISGSSLRDLEQIYDTSIHHQATFYRVDLLKKVSYVCKAPEGTGEYNLLLDAIFNQKASVKYFARPISRFALGGISTSNFGDEWERYVRGREALHRIYFDNKRPAHGKNFFVYEESGAADLVVDQQLPPQPKGQNMSYLKRTAREAIRRSIFFRIYKRVVSDASNRSFAQNAIHQTQMIEARTTAVLDHRLQHQSDWMKVNFDALQEAQRDTGELLAAHDAILTALASEHAGLLDSERRQSEWMKGNFDALHAAQQGTRELLAQHSTALRTLSIEHAGLLDSERQQSEWMKGNFDALHGAHQAGRELLAEHGTALRALASDQTSLADNQRRMEARIDGLVHTIAVQKLELDYTHGRLSKLVASTISRMPQAKSFDDAGFGVYSQFDEDGLIEFLVRKLPDIPPYFVEVGCSAYREANTRFLAEYHNWRGTIIDGSKSDIDYVRNSPTYWRYGITAICALVDADNVDELCARHAPGKEIGLLSIDVDGVDYWLWERIESVSPWIVITEYNGIYGPEAAVTVPYVPDFDRTKIHYSWLHAGASISAFAHLAKKKDYVLMGVNSAHNNAFWVRGDLVKKYQLKPVDYQFRVPNFREARSPDGSLSLLYLEDAVELIADMELVDVTTGEKTTVGEAVKLPRQPAGA